MQERSTPRNRYPGVKPFNTEEREAFFGRERETEELFRLVYVKQVVVLYAKSGFGKSSLLNAGIIPKLLDDSAYHPLTIRFTNRSTQEADTGLHPIDTLKIRLQNELDVSLPSPVSQLTNDDNSLWHWLKTWQNLHFNRGLILLFDQFEELFTYSPVAVSTFSEELAEVLYSPIPLKYRRRLAELSKTKQLDDDFHDFLYQKPDLKIVFSIRTDRLALLNQLTDRHPAILQHCYELMPLRADQAEAALTQPAALPATDYDSPPFDYAPEAVQAILDSILKNGQVEATSVLQIVGRHIESEIVLSQGKTFITDRQLGPVTDIIQNYYRKVLLTLTFEDREKSQMLIENKLISGQLRNPLSEAFILQEFKISKDLLKILENSTLLRTERDAAGRLLYEISHDSLIDPILKSKQEREYLNLKEDYINKFEISLFVFTSIFCVIIWFFSESEKSLEVEKLLNIRQQVTIQKFLNLQLMLFKNDIDRQVQEGKIEDASIILEESDELIAKKNKNYFPPDSLIYSDYKFQLNWAETETALNKKFLLEKRRFIDSLIRANE